MKQRPVLRPARRVLLLFFAFLLSAAIFFPPVNLFAGKQIRESILAGAWYPDRPEHLRAQVNRFLDEVKPPSPAGRLVGLIAPHAGYQYSGHVAAHAYHLLQSRQFKTVVVIAPSHRARFQGVSVYDRGGYRTPLGVLALDTDLIAGLKSESSDVHHVPEAHRKEHALEIQLPFLQVVAPGIKLVPLVMGEQNLSACRKLALALAQCIKNKSVLLIASSDLSHFHSYDAAKKLDAQAARHIREMDVEGLSRDLADGACEACGGGPVMTVMLAARLLGAEKRRDSQHGQLGRRER